MSKEFSTTTKQMTLVSLDDLQRILHSLEEKENNEIVNILLSVWKTYRDSLNGNLENRWEGRRRNWWVLKDTKPNAAAGYYDICIKITGWDSWGDAVTYEYDVTPAIAKLVKCNLTKSGQIKVGSSSAMGWSYSDHLITSIERALGASE